MKKEVKDGECLIIDSDHVEHFEFDEECKNYYIYAGHVSVKPNISVYEMDGKDFADYVMSLVGEYLDENEDLDIAIDISKRIQSDCLGYNFFKKIKFYHGTSEKNYNSIIRFGGVIKSGFGSTSKKRAKEYGEHILEYSMDVGFINRYHYYRFKFLELWSGAYIDECLDNCHTSRV